MMIIAGLSLILCGILTNVIGWPGGYIIIISGSALTLIKVYLLFVREDKKKRKEALSQEALSPDPSPDPVRPTEIIYSTVFKAAGVTYKCQKDKEKSRQDILAGLSAGDFLYLEEFEYNEDPAYLVVDFASDLDIGTVPADLTEMINDKFYGNVTEMEVETVDSFIPDDKTEEIYFCKVKLAIYDR